MIEDFEEIWVPDEMAQAAKNVSRSVVIYGLFDPMTKEIRYVGKTTVLPSIRYSAHLRDKRPSRKINWIASLRKLGELPVMEILETIDGGSVTAWQDAERFWISYLRFIGARLTNQTIGGEGLEGHSFSDDHRKRIGEAHRGTRRSEETRSRMAQSRKGVSFDHLIKISKANIGKQLSPEHRAKLSEAGVGRRHSEETKRKMSASMKGLKRSEETRRKISEAQKRRSAEHQEKLSAHKRGKTLSAEHRMALSVAQTGRKHSEATKQKMRDSWLLRNSKSPNQTQNDG